MAPQLSEHRPREAGGEATINSSNERIDVPWSVSDMAVATAMVVGSSVAFVLLLMPLALAVGDERTGPAVPWLVAVSESVLLLAVWMLAVRKYRVNWEIVGLRSPRTRRNPLLVGATLVGSLHFTGIYVVVVVGLGIEALEPEPLPDGLLEGGPVARLLTALAIAGWVPFVEEVFFRGFLFQGLASRYGVLWGAVVSSSMFAVAHLMVGSMVPIFVTGLLFAWLYARSRSLWLPMAAHGAQNLVALIVAG
jgi:membrane protease YdiL (CAAX protease family)